MKKALRIIAVILCALLLLVVVFFGVLTLTEYKPQAVEDVRVDGTGKKALSPGDSLTVLSWNIGYGALGDNADFFMDGGKGVRTADRARVDQNLSGIASAIEGFAPDICMMQEVDIHSDRSWHVDEAERLSSAMPGAASAFAQNYLSLYVPFPVPPIGHVDGGIVTLSSFSVREAQRVSLPCPFSWPIRLGQLKRCLLVTRIPLEGTDKELVAVNLHLEAYDDGEGKAAQTRQLAQFLRDEADKGNYVIAGGDFNQVFSTVDMTRYPTYEGMWLPGKVETEAFGDDFTLLMDDKTPSCRSLDRPYAGADRETFQYYVIDGYIVSQNVRVETVQTQQMDFTFTDHNPVMLKVTLEP